MWPILVAHPPLTPSKLHRAALLHTGLLLSMMLFEKDSLWRSVLIFFCCIWNKWRTKFLAIGKWITKVNISQSGSYVSQIGPSAMPNRVFSETEEIFAGKIVPSIQFFPGIGVVELPIPLWSSWASCCCFTTGRLLSIPWLPPGPKAHQLQHPTLLKTTWSGRGFLCESKHWLS